MCARGACQAASRGRSTSPLGTRLVLALAILGLILLSLSLWAWRQNRSTAPELQPPWTRLWRWRWGIGSVLGVAAFFVRYPITGRTDHYTVYGVPFMSYAFDQRGFDYAGALTLPALVLNFVTWALLPQLFFWLYGKRHGRDRGGASA